MKLKNYILGQWIEGSGSGKELVDASNGAYIATADASGLDIESIMKYGRKEGGSALRKMSFRERGLMLKKLALHLFDLKDKYYPISFQTGATKVDSWIDIEGGIGNLFANASLRRQFPDLPYHVDGAAIPLSKNGNFMGHHIMVPKQGVAIHINAFNFPIWGMLEKIAVNLLAGMPAVVKPATLTSYLTQAMVQDIAKSEILPEGALQLICGSARNILDHVESQDVVTFTGSAETGKMLKTHKRIIDEAVPFNMEADSLNAIVLGEHVAPDSELFKIFIKEVRKEMTVKCGQKCTAIRRIVVPEDKIEVVQCALSAQLQKMAIGDPRNKDARMGALAGLEQVQEVKDRVKALLEHSEMVYGSLDSVHTLDGTNHEGAFMSPILLLAHDPMNNESVHDIEAFGPVSTLLPYKGMNQAIELAQKGKGSLVCSMVSADNSEARAFTIGAASHHGRILILNEECAKESTGHGSPLPMLVHGGPGRAGGGEEMGGVRGVKHYLQRCAIQSSPSTITEITQQYQAGAAYKDTETHPFRKHFEELEVGDTVITHKRSITETDIVNFANVSWDHFYAHTDETSLDGTIFEQRVAHGYFILSAAAGLFVWPGKGPVLLNYGLESFRFTKPVYAGATIQVRLTVQEKKDQEPKDDVAKGIVKFYVEVVDETEETVAVGTILTMVKKLDQSEVTAVE